MGKNTLIGVSSAAKKVRKIYVGVSNTAHKVKKGYIGIDGVARLFYTGDPVLIYESQEAGSKSLSLSAGTYEITLIGGGGGGVALRSSSTGGKHYAQGGVGGTLQIIAVLTSAATVTITCGGYGSSASGTFASASAGTTSGTDGGTSTGTTRTANGRVNDNWTEDNTRGKGGDVGWNGTTFLKATGASGFVRIRQL